MLKRKLYDKLLAWKLSDRRKPLIVRGARQVGKSTLIRLFGKEYDHFIELNLEKAEDRRLFELENLKAILEILFVKNRIPPGKVEVLIFIDEIQESPAAIRHLRFFYEDFPEIHVICAGSLLEHVIRQIPSYPVGRIQQLLLHPFDFEEFLWAKGNEWMISLFKEIPVGNQFDELFFNAFHEFAVIGGMPEVVRTYIDSGTYTGIFEIYDEIWQTYKDDIEKYGKNDTEKKVLRHIVATAAHETNRITFAGFGHSNYRSREVGEAFRSLHKARLIQLVYPTISIQLPIMIDFRRQPRLQFLDTGLLNHILGIQPEMIEIKDLVSLYRGRIIQHLVYQEIQAQIHSIDDDLHFWVREKAGSSAEVDLVIPHGNRLIPIEVKSGHEGRLRSLHLFMDQAGQGCAIRLLRNHLSVQEAKTASGKSYKLLNLPYYLASQVEKYASWMG